MKKIISLVLAVAMVLSCIAFAGCGSKSNSNTIKLGTLGPYTGDTAVYGLAVRNGVELYVNEVNANGGINGKQVELIYYDNKGDDAEAITAFNKLVDDGVVAVVGDVLTSNAMAVVPEAYAIGMPIITPSATAKAVTRTDDGFLYTNCYRTCFIDPFQGEKMAKYASEKLGAKTAAVMARTGDVYAEGIRDKFVETCKQVGIEVVDSEGYATGDKDFNAQLTNILAKNPDVLLLPNYYEDIGMIIKQARALGLNCTMIGGDGWAGVKDYATAEELEGSVYCSAYAPGSTEEVVAFEKAYTAAYGAEALNMFSALAYDAAKLVLAAVESAEAEGLETGSGEYMDAVLDAIPVVGPSVKGITSANGYTFDEDNNPIKDAVIIELKGGEEIFKEIF